MNPSNGVFLSPDPKGYVDSSSLYVYAGQDPINNIDQHGEDKSSESDPWGAKSTPERIPSHLLRGIRALITNRERHLIDTGKYTYIQRPFSVTTTSVSSVRYWGAFSGITSIASGFFNVLTASKMKDNPSLAAFVFVGGQYGIWGGAISVYGYLSKSRSSIALGRFIG